MFVVVGVAGVYAIDIGVCCCHCCCRWLWVEAGTQQEFEAALEIGGYGYPVSHYYCHWLYDIGGYMTLMDTLVRLAINITIGYLPLVAI